MFYHMALYGKSMFPCLHVVHYISFRILGGLLTSLFFAIFFGDRFIVWSKRFFCTNARPYTPEQHKKKDGTPTMGGLFILMTVALNCLWWCNLAKSEVWIMLSCLVLFGGIGFCDDWLKVARLVKKK